MSQKLISLRVELSKRLADAQVVGRSRELSLAVTSIQSARMLFGSVALILGSVNPYPEADKPASAVIHPSADLAVDYVPVAVVDQLSSVKWLRVFLQVEIDAAVALRSELWARPYASAISITAEVLFDRAVQELFLAKQWLGEQLAVIAGHALVKPSLSGGFAVVLPDVVPSTHVVVDKAEADELEKLVAEVAALTGERPITFTLVPSTPELEAAIKSAKSNAEGGVVTQRAEEVAQSVTETEPAAGAERMTMHDVVRMTQDATPRDPAAGMEEGVTPAEQAAGLAAGAERRAVDETIRARLVAGETVTEICRTLNVTEYRVNKIKKAMPATAAE
ncbi:MAG: hypothetical protein WC205_04175 [Opitutaceae bacterium]|jgi:hypothetical protein